MYTCAKSGLLAFIGLRLLTTRVSYHFFHKSSVIYYATENYYHFSEVCGLNLSFFMFARQCLAFSALTLQEGHPACKN